MTKKHPITWGGPARPQAGTGSALEGIKGTIIIVKKLLHIFLKAVCVINR